MKQYLLLITILLLIISPISAEGFVNITYDNTTQPSDSYIINPGVQYPLVKPYRLPSQGAYVYINDTVDISGQGWADGVSWYGHWGEYSHPQYIRMFPENYNKQDQRNFYIDPAIFKDRWGMWYQYYENNATERNGNLAAFFVKDGTRLTTTTYANGTSISTTIGENNATNGYIKPVEDILPEVRISDYNLARGDLLDTGFERLWVFGRTTGYYAHDSTLTITEVNAMEYGTYKIAEQTKGSNGIYEVNYDADKSLLTSPWRNVSDVSLYGSQPLLDIDKVKGMIATTTDDTITFHNLEVSEPSITVNSITEVDVGSRFPLIYTPGMTLLDIKGYTNLAKGSELSFVVDPDKQTARTLKSNTYKTTAVRTDPGMMSTYQIYVPINKNDMESGMHTVEVKTRIGASMRYDFPVFELPPNSFVPNATLKYIGDENPWKPNLTIPEPIVIVQTPIIVEKVVTVTIPVPPSQDSLDSAQRSAIIGIITYAIIVVFVGVVCVYLAIAFIRGRKRE